MNDYVIPLSKLSYDKEACLEFFKTLDFGNRWDDRPTGRYIRAENPDGYLEVPCIKQINNQLPYSVNFQFIKIVGDWTMPIHIDTYRTAVLMIPLSPDPAPTYWYEEPDYIQELRLSGDRDAYIKASRKLKIDPIYTHIHDGIPTIINSELPHGTDTQNGIDRLTIQIGMANTDTGPFLSWDEIFEKVKDLV